jgi:hypothetical protein
MRKIIYSTLAALAALLLLAGTAPAAERYSTIELRITCDAAQVRTEPGGKGVVMGIAHRGDRGTATKSSRKKDGHIDYWYGTWTRQVDGIKVTGWVRLECANPYEQ